MNYRTKAASTLILATSLGLYGCGSDNSSSTAAPSQQSTQKTAPTLVERCASAAVDEGYRSGTCAWPFMNTCVTTQSKIEMEKTLRFAGVQRTMTEACSQYSSYSTASEYAKAFEKAYAPVKRAREQADKF